MASGVSTDIASQPPARFIVGNTLAQKSLSVSIKNSLMTSIFLLLVMLGGLSVMTKIKLSSLQETIETVGRDRLPKIRALGEINIGVTRVRSVAVRIALTATHEQRVEVEKVLTSRTAALNQKVEKFRLGIKEGSPHKLIFDQFVNKWMLYQKYQAKILDQEIARDRKLLSDVVNVETAGHFQAVVDAIDDGIKLADQEADLLIEDAIADSQFYATVLWVVNIVSIVIGLATLIFVVKDVSTPIHHITRSMELIARGKLETEIPYADRTNELGLMARALVVFKRSLIENDRLSAATRTLSELSEWLQSAKSEVELYDMISTVLGDLMPECKGSLYIYANSRDVLEIATHWNGPSRTHSLHPEDCWSLRRGHPYVHGTSEIEFHCDHVHADINENYCCIPILAHGETVGLLHLEYVPQGAETAAEAKSRFADRVRLGQACAEHLSIAIANMKLREGLRDQSVRDVLTGLNNRRYLLEAARRELLRAARHSAPTAFITVDVDHFKSFNDNHGHDAGDTVLRHVGEVMRAIFTDDAVPCRFGGEEFVVMLPNTRIEEAALRAEEFRARMEQLVIRYADANLPRVTISAGVAAFPEAGDNLTEILRVADEALYQAKQNGRNRVELAGGYKPATSAEAVTDEAVIFLRSVMAQAGQRPAQPTQGSRLDSRAV